MRTHVFGVISTFSDYAGAYTWSLIQMDGFGCWQWAYEDGSSFLDYPTRDLAIAAIREDGYTFYAGACVPALRHENRPPQPIDQRESLAYVARMRARLLALRKDRS